MKCPCVHRLSLSRNTLLSLLFVLTVVFFGVMLVLNHLSLFETILLKISQQKSEDTITIQCDTIGDTISIAKIINMTLSANIIQNVTSIAERVEIVLNSFIRCRNKHRIGKTHLTLNLDGNISSSVTTKRDIHITVSGGSAGRLGNRMFQYASLLGITQSLQQVGLHAVPVLEDDSHLHSILSSFEGNRIKRISELVSPVGIDEEKPMAFSKTILPAIKSGFNYTLRTYFQSWKYFQNISHIIRQEFHFKSGPLYGMKQVLIQLAKDLPSERPTTVIGVHIRRRDMGLASSTKRGYSMADTKYIAKALNFYRTMFTKVKFIVCSDDVDWALSNVKGSDVHFSRDNSPEVDMAILSMCDHSVITSGSFGWWSAWLAGGIVVYYKNFPTPGTWLDSQCERSEYYPPEWIGLT